MGKWLNKLLGERDFNDDKNATIDKREFEITEEEKRKPISVELTKVHGLESSLHKPIEARLLNVELRLLELEQMLTQYSPNTGNKVLSPMARKFRKMRGY